MYGEKLSIICFIDMDLGGSGESGYMLVRVPLIL